MCSSDLTSKTDNDPIDLSGLPAHYYRFVSIMKGKYLVKDGTAALGYSYSGGSLAFDPVAVQECDPNPRTADYAAYPGLVDKMTEFTTAFSKMIDALKVAFGSQDQATASAAYDNSIRAMRSMASKTQAIYRAAEHAGVKGGIPFERTP